MLSSLRAISLACAFAGTLGLCVGCSQGEGDRCEIDSDCGGGLICAPTGSPHNNVCRPISSPGTGGGAVEDAAGPATTGADGAAEAADAAASVDAGVAADGATVGVDTPPDADAATDLSAAD